VKFGTKVQTWDTLPKPNFVEIAFKNLGKIYKKKIINDGYFGGSKPTFLKPQRRNFA